MVNIFAGNDCFGAILATLQFFKLFKTNKLVIYVLYPPTGGQIVSSNNAIYRKWKCVTNVVLRYFSFVWRNKALAYP